MEQTPALPTHIVTAAGIVVNKKSEILMVRHHRQGWVFPGGMVEPGENILDALKREIFEETGIETEAGEVFCISSNTTTHPGYGGVKEVPTKVMLDFVCRPVGGTVRPSEENDKTEWFPRDTAASLITAPQIQHRFRAFEEYDGRPVYLEYATEPAFTLRLKTKI